MVQEAMREGQDEDITDNIDYLARQYQEDDIEQDVKKPSRVLRRVREGLRRSESMNHRWPSVSRCGRNPLEVAQEEELRLCR